MLRNFFMANPARMIHRYPRYGELYTAHEAQKSAGHARGSSARRSIAICRCFRKWRGSTRSSQDKDPEVRALVAKGRNYTLEDQALMGRKQQEICALVIPEYRKLAAAGQIEISTTPFYHPILPLICDSDIAGVSHPVSPLPPRFSYPEDARLQLRDGARLREADFRRGARGTVAFGRFGFGPGARDRRLGGFRMGGYGQRRARPDAGTRRLARRHVPALALGADRANG